MSFASNCFARLKARKFFSRKGAKAQRKTLETRQRFAPLRLCVSNLLHTGTFRQRCLNSELSSNPLIPIAQGVAVTPIRQNHHPIFRQALFCPQLADLSTGADHSHRTAAAEPDSGSAPR